MKNVILFFAGFALMTLQAQAQAQATLDANGCLSNRAVSKQPLAIKSIEDTQSTFAWDSVRALAEINTPNADAYPYLSPDGLRLYFTQNNNLDNLYYVSRPNLVSPFSNQRVVSYTFPEGSKGCWLTNDELEIYHVSNSVLYYAARSTISDSFSAPITIDLVGNTPSFLSGPSLTPDKEELYLYDAFRILKFKKTDNVTYTLDDTLEVPVNTTASPGQLSKDGLKYFLGIVDTFGFSKIYYFSRNSLNTNFSNPTLLDSNINTPYFSHFQPSVSSNENIIVWTSNNTGWWADNDLYIAKNIISGTDDKIEHSFTIYPNPATNKCKIKYNTNKNFNIEIFSLLGKKLLQTEAHPESCEIDISALPKGVYLIRVSGDHETVQQKFIKE